MPVSKQIAVGARFIGPGHPCFIIAEIGSNHDQDLGRAKELISIAAAAGADAAKFQSILVSELFVESAISRETRDFFRQVELDERWYEELRAHCVREKILLMSAPTYLRAVELLAGVGVAVYKLASPQVIGFTELIRAAARTGKPAIMSTGYCLPAEIARGVRAFRAEGNDQLALLHCTANYPCPPDRVNLAFMDTLRAEYGVPVGYSDHTLGLEIALAAVARGANLLEKHITVSRAGRGPDHSFAIEPDELVTLVRQVRTIEAALGDGRKTAITEAERAIIPTVQMKLVAARALPSGSVLTRADINFRRTATGLHEDALRGILGKATARSLERDQPIGREDLCAAENG